MPNRKKSKNQKKNRPRKSNAIVQQRNGTPGTSLIGAIGSVSATPLPSRFRTVLRYGDQFTTSTAAVTGNCGAITLFRPHSLFDPNQTAFGTFPYSFDQLKVLYAKYVVTACRYRFIANSIGGTAEIAMHVSLSNSDGFVTLAGLSTAKAMERNNVATVLLSPSGNHRTAEISGRIEIHKLFGVTLQAYRTAESQYSALVTANPAQNANLMIAVSSPSATAGEQASILVFLEYECELFEPITQATST